MVHMGGRERDYRKFDGKRYKFKASFATKSEANKVARAGRKRGHSCRVTSVKMDAGTYKGKTRRLLWSRKR